jgi:hypothetical protein
MKKRTVLFLGILFMFLCAGEVAAQVKAMVQISTVKENGKKVYFTVTSSKQFIVGDNIYVLHIGNKVFWLSEQSQNNEQGTLTFFIPADDFKDLEAGSGIYLTYGNKSMEEDEMKEMSKLDYSRCWSLGQFSSALLTK